MSLERNQHYNRRKNNLWRIAPHAFLMVLPNLLHPHKLVANIRHPIYEVVHTGHKQYPLETDDRHVVEHSIFGRLVTIDVIDRDEFPKGLVPRVKQLFRKDFYYGHCEYFPQPFRLVDRTYVNGNIFDYQEHIRKFRKSGFESSQHPNNFEAEQLVPIPEEEL